MNPEIKANMIGYNAAFAQHVIYPNCPDCYGRMRGTKLQKEDVGTIIYWKCTNKNCPSRKETK